MRVRHSGCALRASAQVSCGCSGLPSSCGSEDAATAGAVGSVGRRDIQRQRFQPPQVRATRLELIAAEADTCGRQTGEALGAAVLAFGMRAKVSGVLENYCQALRLVYGSRPGAL